MVHEGGEALIRTPLKELLARLDEQLFWQVHRSVIVNHRCTASAVRVDEGEMHLTLRGRAEKLPVSKHFQGLFKGSERAGYGRGSAACRRLSDRRGRRWRTASSARPATGMCVAYVPSTVTPAISPSPMPQTAEEEQKALRRAAQGAEVALETWFDHAPGFVALLRGPRFVFEMVNEAYYQLVGHRELLGLPVFEALPEARGQGFEGILRRVFDTGTPFVGRALPISLQRQAGGPFTDAYVDLVYEPVLDPAGGVVGIFAQGHDVSEQVHALRALEEADRRKDEFLAILAHELRNPMAPILAAARLAREPGLRPERLDWALSVIERQSRHMGLLLDDLLDVSRISRGHLELSLSPVALASVLAAAAEIAEPSIAEHRHRLGIAPTALVVMADPLRLGQVFSNLLSNAAKYTEPGGEIAIEAAAEGNEAVVRVRDNGIGIAIERQVDIFEMFTQAPEAQARAQGGLGIGLALSRGLVAAHGGSLTVHSAGPGQGSAFTVRVALAEAGLPHPADAARPGTESARRRVLIADDNVDALETLGALLELAGHEVHTAQSGPQALQVAAAVRPEVAILDIGMPGMTGLEVAATLRAAERGPRMTMIALTGWGQEHDRARALVAGFDHHCVKPIDIESIRKLVEAPLQASAPGG